MQWDLGHQHKLSQLKKVQFLMHIFEEDVDNVLYLVCFLKAVPFMEKLELHVCTLASSYLLVDIFDLLLHFYIVSFACCFSSNPNQDNWSNIRVLF